MTIVDMGSGPPVVVVPGIQGRWEWLRPAVEALAEHCRVVTFSLADEPRARAKFDERRGFTSYVEQVREAMDAVRLERAVVCGVSYGGLIAAAFAARHQPRAAGLALVSAIPPRWTPDRRVRFYLRAPRLLSPLFCVASLRLYREIAAANGGFMAGLAPMIGVGLTAVTNMFSPARMARRIRLVDGLDLERELASLRVPTLVVTGEATLDRIVPVCRTHEYLSLWPHAAAATIARTGHLGAITQPARFGGVVAPFVEQTSDEHGQEERIAMPPTQPSSVLAHEST